MNNTLSSQWIRTPSFDLTLITGGAIFTLIVALTAFQMPALLPIFFWSWVILFEGSHFWATFSRTYFDKKFFHENQALLVGSLVFFIFPAIAVYLDTLSVVSFTTIYGLFIFTWSLYHNARQHYGFVSIYSSKIKMAPELKDRVVKALYLCIIFSQIYFLFNFKVPGTFNLSTSSATLQWILADLPIFLTLGSGIYFASVMYRLVRTHGSASFPVVNYIGTCLFFYSVMFYIIAPHDLFIQGPNGGEKLMLIAIMNSLFHNIQYHAIVWHYGQSRYKKEEPRKTYGLAQLFNSRTSNYLLFSVIVGTLFGFIVWNVGDWPWIDRSFENVKAHNWAYILFFGIIGHHFYLDSKVWRPSRQKDLKSYLEKA